MTTSPNHPPLIGFAAWSGTGKTTLLEKLIPLLRKKGLRVGVIKHGHHDFDIDHKGKDSYRLRKAGAVDTIVASGKRWAHIHENEDDSQIEPNLRDLLKILNSHANPDTLDIILIEGFKHEPISRIELHRPALKKPLLYPEDEKIIAIATDGSDKISHPIKQLNMNDPIEIVAFIVQYIEQQIKQHIEEQIE